MRLFTPVVLALLAGAIVLPKPGFALSGQVLYDTKIAQVKTYGTSGPRYNHLVNEFNEEFAKINGQGVTAAVVDAGAVLQTHSEFRRSASGMSQITLLTKKPPDDHSTFVAGIIGAKGQNERAKGLAPGVALLSLDWDDDLRKLRTVAPRIQISNHSYAPQGGWHFLNPTSGWAWFGDEKLNSEEDAKFGKYGPREAEFDNVLHGFPKLLAFVAAGNNRTDGPTEKQPFKHQVFSGQDSNERVLTKFSSNLIHKLNDWDRGGLDTLTGLCLSKNDICVGAIDNIMQSRPITIESYSGWGPADDGRIKPDLVASGENVFSASGNNSYTTMSGTAMATAVGSGIAALLIQLYRDTRGGFKRMPTAAEIKAVLIHTATDAGVRGPDPIYGWGSINTQLAGQVIAHKDTAGKFVHLISTGQLNAGVTKKASLIATGSRFKVTLVWTDPAGKINTGRLDDALPTLQNDLDIRLISPEGKVYYPYSLDPQRPLSPALNDGPNRVDNVEVINITTSQPGQEWKLELKARKLNVGLSQSFALVVSGLKAP